MTAEQYTEEIKAICQELLEAADAIGKLEPVSHLSSSKIQFTGGILGAIQDVKEEKRLVKLINAPIYKEFSFCKFAYHIMAECELLVEKQLEVQKQTSPDNPIYYGNVELIMNSIQSAYDAWYNYSPDMASASITIENVDNVDLNLSVRHYTKEDIGKLDLPPKYKSNNESISQGNSTGGGCFGIIVLFIAGTISLIDLSYFGIQQLFS